MASSGAYDQDDLDLIQIWGNRLILTSYVASMVVNALVTGLIAFKITVVSKWGHAD